MKTKAKKKDGDRIRGFSQPKIVESFSDPRMASRAKASVEDFLAWVPREHLGGLDLIHLRDLGSLTKRERLEKVKGRRGMVRKPRIKGIYREPFKRSGARIELFIDQVFLGLPSWAIHIPIIRNLFIGSILCHELGHHIQYRRRIKGAPEAVADAWQKRLMKDYAGYKYPWLVRYRGGVRWVLGCLKGMSRILNRGPKD